MNVKPIYCATVCLLTRRTVLLMIVAFHFLATLLTQKITYSMWRETLDVRSAPLDQH